MSDNVLGIALTKELCLICAKTEMDGEIMMNKVLNKSQAKKVEDLHGKVVQFSKEPCDQCKEYLAKGFVLIGAVEAKTDDVTSPYRSGNIYVVKQEVADRLFAPMEAPKSGVSFVDVNVLVEMGFPGVNIDA